MIRKSITFADHGRQLGLPITIAVAAMLVWAAGTEVADLLRFQREAIASGQYWRLLTGHWAHLGWQHLALNLAGVVVIWLLVGETLAGFKGWLLTGVIALATSLGLLIFHPQIQWYVGLSGILHGLLVAGALQLLRSNPVVAWSVLLIVTGKLILELFAGGNAQMAQFIGGPILTHAHSYGALGGALGAASVALAARYAASDR